MVPGGSGLSEKFLSGIMRVFFNAPAWCLFNVRDLKMPPFIRPFFLLMTMLALEGCVGMTYSRPRLAPINGYPHISSADGPTIYNPLRANYQQLFGPPMSQIGENSFIYVRNSQAWCGVTIWAGLPLPLKLPVCTESHFVTLNEDRPVKDEVTLISDKYFFCSPAYFLVSWHGQVKTALCDWGENL